MCNEEFHNFLLLGRVAPAPGVEVVEVGEEAAHPIEVLGEVVLLVDVPHAWEMVHFLVELEGVGFARHNILGVRTAVAYCVGP